MDSQSNEQSSDDNVTVPNLVKRSSRYAVDESEEEESLEFDKDLQEEEKDDIEYCDD